MIYPQNFEEKIGFTTVKLHISKHILCDLGKKYLEDMCFTDNLVTLRTWLSETNEMANLLRNGLSFPQQDYLDPTSELIRIKTPGTAIEPESLSVLRVSLNTIKEIQRFLEKQEPEKVTHLLAVASRVIIEDEILIEIDRIIDPKGLIKSSASPVLKEIRSKLVQKQRFAESIMAKIFTQVKREGLAGDDLEVTIRNGRPVIPVPVSYKRRIKGFIHDESATGQTVFIEPAEVFEINNEIRELENAELREIHRILTEIANFIRPHIENLLQCYYFLGKIDFIRAKARFAIDINAYFPHLHDFPVCEWKNAVHPLLYISHRSQKKTVVPLDLSLNQQQRILIISGPNAGGKSVALKTAGLLQYMLQCGLLIPVDENSEAGIFKKIFIDIGDEQSLEHDLSTYTSHLKNLRYFIENADGQTLILIDEFGSGTEPQLGGAIAEASIEDFAGKGCFGVITTHYANLKDAARRIRGIINGAMLFDPENLSPLFVLRIGNPGSSYAFEIAEKIGFPVDILKKAEGKINKSAIDYDKLLQELEVEKAALDQKKTGIRITDEFLSELVGKYKLMNSELKAEKEKILKEAREEALRIIERSNKLIENTVQAIKESKAEKQTVLKLRKKVREERTQLESEIKELVEDKPETQESTKETLPVLTVGNWVRIKNQTTVGQIIEIRDQEVVLQAGQMMLHVRADRLVAASPSDKNKSEQQGVQGRISVYKTILDRTANFKLSIDLRGKKAEEALQIVRRHVDDAILLSIAEFTIIHGKGDGILRNVIRDYLKSIPEVKSLKEGHPDRGGAGMTIVSFR
ncbi:MAG: Smr/MutS family protein [Bacteroidales bacterium]